MSSATTAGAGTPIPAAAGRTVARVETFVVESWAEYLRQRERMTMTDRDVRDQVYRYQRGTIPPPVSRMVYVPTKEA